MGHAGGGGRRGDDRDSQAQFEIPRSDPGAAAGAQGSAQTAQERIALAAPKAMALKIQSNGHSTVVEFSGKLDSSLPEEDRNRIIEVLRPGGSLTLDLSKLTSVSSVGLRMLLLLARQISAVGAVATTKGIPAELCDAAE